jgi:peptide/nickel transport system permease protein
MATPAAKPGPLDWLPRYSILGRIFHPLFEERRSLAGAMTWIGIGVIIAFLFVAVFADILAPFNPIELGDEKDVPPWTNAAVPRNQSFQAWMTPTDWTDIAAATRFDGVGAVSNRTGQFLNTTGFPMGILRDSVESVGFVVRITPGGTAPGQYGGVRVSWDGGRTWSSKYLVRAVGPEVRVDLTGLTAWNRAKLSTSNLNLNVTHESDPGTTGNVSLDYLGATAVWRSYWHFLGTDPVGRDVLSRVLFGTRTSLAIMTIGVLVALAVGFPLGLYSGYRGGNLDKIIVLVMDSIYSFPGLLFAGLIAVLLGKGVVNIGLAVTVIYIPLYFRVTRSQVLAAREELYVEAARALGASPLRIVFKYIAVNVLVAIPVIFSISAADAILTAAGLSYLGLGVSAPTPDWGLDLSDAASRIDTGVWWSSFFPGLAILLLTIGLSFVGEGLNDIINPLLKKER